MKIIAAILGLLFLVLNIVALLVASGKKDDSEVGD